MPEEKRARRALHMGLMPPTDDLRGLTLWNLESEYCDSAFDDQK